MKRRDRFWKFPVEWKMYVVLESVYVKKQGYCAHLL